MADHHEDERGNTLVLMPVGVLVVLALAAIAVDSALVYRAQSELDAAAAGLVNDAAAAVDQASFFDTDTGIVIDPSTLDTLARRHAAVADDLDASCRATVTTTGDEPVVTAACTGTAHTIFRGVVGAATDVDVTTTATATLRRG